MLFCGWDTPPTTCRGLRGPSNRLLRRPWCVGFLAGLSSRWAVSPRAPERCPPVVMPVGSPALPSQGPGASQSWASAMCGCYQDNMDTGLPLTSATALNSSAGRDLGIVTVPLGNPSRATQTKAKLS